MPTQITQIALVDDHRLFRSGIASLIGQFSGYNILFEAAHGQELVEQINAGQKTDVILLDINMPEMDGFTTTQWLKKNNPEIKIVILSMFQDADKVLKMVRLGVHGYLLKDSEPYEFELALKTVANNELYYPSFVTDHLIKNLNQKEQIKLNNREIEFLRLAGTELTYKEIADQMCISARTVDGYRDQLFEKLQIKSRVGLVLYAIKNNLIQL